MSGQDVTDFVKTALDRWGLPTLACIAFAWTLRADVLLPLVKTHQEFVQNLEQTQRDIAESMREQAELLREMRSDLSRHRTVDVRVPAAGEN